MRFSFSFACGLSVSAILSSVVAEAATVTINPPTVNRWNYPFGAANGTRQSASIFGSTSGPTTMFDERDAQYLLGFDTALAGVPTGLGAGSYQINSVTLTFSVQDPSGEGGSTFVYDPTYDSYTTYDGAADTDAGRPIEVYGIGFRNGYTQLGLAPPNNTPPNWTVGSAFAPPGPALAGTRSAYALGSNGASLVDVSNNVGSNGITSGFEVTPLGIATALLAPGAPVPHNGVMTVPLAVGNSLYLAYLQEALDSGVLGLAVTSLHEAAQGGDTVYPVINTIHTPSISDSLRPSLTIDYTIVPEPSTWMLLGIGLMSLSPWLRKKLR